MQSEQNRTDKCIKKWQPQTTEKLSERSFLDNINSVDDKLINHEGLQIEKMVGRARFERATNWLKAQY